MIIIPQRLFTQPTVKVILRDGNLAILSKQLQKNTGRREGYLACHVFAFVLAGHQIIESQDDQVVTVRAGEAILLRRGLYHISDFVAGKSGFKSLLFYFDDLMVMEWSSLRVGTPVENDQNQDYIHFSASDGVTHFAESIPKIYAGQPGYQPAVLRLKLMELLHLLSQTNGSRVASFLGQLNTSRKRGIRAFMQRNYHKQLKVADYAYLTGRSMSSFRRDFKQTFGQTPQQWLKEQRLAEAVRLIRQQPISVNELAYAVGYDNVSYFIREFQQHTGQTPKQFMLLQ